MSKSEISLEVDKLSPGEWDSLLCGFHDATLFQTWEYGQCTWGEQNLSHAVLKRDGRPVAAAQVRVWNRLPGLKYAYLVDGPIWQPRGGPAETDAFGLMIRALVSEYVQKRRYSLKLAPFVHDGDPQSEIVRDILARNLFTPTRQTGKTLILDISASEGALRANLRRKWRQELGYAERGGLDVRCDTSDELLAQCFEVYREMHDRKQFTEHTPMDAFLTMHALLPSRHKFRVVTVGQDGELHACLVGSAIGDTAFPILAATATRGLKSNASYVAYWEMLKLYGREGVRWFDFRGIDPTANPGGYTFKTGIAGKNGVEVSYLGEFVRYSGALVRRLLQTVDKSVRHHPRVTTAIRRRFT